MSFFLASSTFTSTVTVLIMACNDTGGFALPREKYSSVSMHALTHLQHLAPGANDRLVAAAFSASTWRRVSAALQSAKKFSLDTGIHLTWPFTEQLVNSYTGWALTTAKLNPRTVKVYLSDLALSHKLRGLEPSACQNFHAKIMVRGAENLASYSAPRTKKTAITLSMLKLIGHEICLSGLEERRRVVLWAACTLAFFGSFPLTLVLRLFAFAELRLLQTSLPCLIISRTI
jgi:hypothetical protein